DNVRGGKLGSGVDLGQGRIIPFLDFPQKNVGQNLSREVDLALDGGKIVSRDIRAEHCGNMEKLEGSAFELLIGHGAIAGAEVDRAGLNLFNAAAAANRLIVDLNVGMQIVVFAEPLGINWIGKSSARPGQICLCGCAAYQQNYAQPNEQVESHGAS